MLHACERINDGRMEPGREAERREGLSGQGAQVAGKMLECACL